MNELVSEMSKKCYELAPNLTICRILNGMWQVAGGHGYIDHELAIADMLRYHDAGFTTWDLADIYGPAEDFIGQFRHRLLKLKGKEELETEIDTWERATETQERAYRLAASRTRSTKASTLGS